LYTEAPLVRRLRRFINAGSEEGFTLLVAWLIAALRGDATKFPVLSLTSETKETERLLTVKEAGRGREFGQKQPGVRRGSDKRKTAGREPCRK